MPIIFRVAEIVEVGEAWTTQSELRRTPITRPPRSARQVIDDRSAVKHIPAKAGRISLKISGVQRTVPERTIANAHNMPGDRYA